MILNFPFFISTQITRKTTRVTRRMTNGDLITHDLNGLNGKIETSLIVEHRTADERDTALAFYDSVRTGIPFTVLIANVSYTVVSTGPLRTTPVGSGNYTLEFPVAEI